jgi:taurine dioxygenase
MYSQRAAASPYLPANPVRIRSLSKAVGVELLGLDPQTLTEEGFATIRHMLDTRGAILVRDWGPSDDELIAFSRRFGELELAPIDAQGRLSPPGRPEILITSNFEDADGRPVGTLGASASAWHADMSYREFPPDYSVSHALVVPAAGGGTWLSTMADAYDVLPADLKRAIAGRRLKHDATYNSSGGVRPGRVATDDPLAAEGAIHPLVCRHPGSGRPVLYLGRRRNAYIVGLPVAESDALLDRLWAYATRPELTYAHRWQAGDVLMWDNRSILHRRDAFTGTDLRLMHRTQVCCSAKPVAA